MDIITTAEALAFLDISVPEAGPGSVSITDGTYTLAELNAEIIASFNQWGISTETGYIYLAGTYDVDTDVFTIDSSDEVNRLIFSYALSGDDYVIAFTNDEGVQTATEADLDPDGQVAVIVTAACKFIENYCKRTFDSTAYTEYINGQGMREFLLGNYPVVSIERIALGGRAAIRVCNTNASTKASVSVTSTGVVLNYNGASNSNSIFTTYTTLTTLVAAINAVSGWSAQLTDSAYGSFLSTELMPVFGKSCINSQWVDLEIPEDAEYDFSIDPDAGIIQLATPLPTGFRNVRVDYTAGYATIPSDIKLAAMILIKDWWNKRNESSFNLSSFGIGGMSKSIIGSVPPETLRIMEAYRRHRI